MEPKTVLLLGGTGKVASRIAPILSSAGHIPIIASRSGTYPNIPHAQGVKFDWMDSSTWATLFNTYPRISAIFLVAPPIMDLFPTMRHFVDLAISNLPPPRLVLLSGSVVDGGDGLLMGEIASYIANLGVGYTVLRPTWFMENFSEGPHASTIRDADCLITATGDGRVPFVACEDIAWVAARALVDKVAHDTDHLIVGAKSFSYGHVAALLTQILGREITHTQSSEAEEAKRMERDGIPADYARMLAELDTHIAQGKEDIASDVVVRVGRREPVRLEDFLRNQAEKGIWEKR